jgi:hypothetical protein
MADGKAMAGAFTWASGAAGSGICGAGTASSSISGGAYYGSARMTPRTWRGFWKGRLAKVEWVKGRLP